MPNHEALRRCFKSFKEVKPIQVSSLLPMITTYSTSSMNLIRHLKNNFYSVLQDESLLQDHRPIAALRRGKNLRDLLVRATVPTLDQPDHSAAEGFYGHCAWVKNKITGKVYKTQSGMSLNSKNCIYLITCNSCGIQYVGETGNSIRVRFYAHKHNMIKGSDALLPISQHFREHGWPAVRVTALEGNPHWSTVQRKRAEKKWVRLLNTTQPQGLNLKQ